MKKKRKKSLIGYVYKDWYRYFNERDLGMPTLYQEEKDWEIDNFKKVKAKITIEEV